MPTVSGHREPQDGWSNTSPVRILPANSRAGYAVSHSPRLRVVGVLTLAAVAMLLAPGALYTTGHMDIQHGPDAGFAR
jgi:hypothetical protein